MNTFVLKKALNRLKKMNNFYFKIYQKIKITVANQLILERYN